MPDHTLSSAPIYEVGLRSGAQSVKAALHRISGTGLSSPFQSLAWVSAWIDQIGTGRACEHLVVEVRDSQTGAPALVLPLVRRIAKGVRMIELPDFGMADYGGPVIAPEFQPDMQAMNQLWSRILAILPPADVLRLNKMPEKIGAASNPLVMLTGVRRNAQSAWGTALGAPPIDFAALGMPKKRTRELNNRMKRLQEIGTVEFRTAGTEEDRDRFFEAMCAQRTKRFEGLGRPNSLSRPDIRAFFRAMLTPGADAAPAVIQAMTVNNQIVATGYGLVGQKTFCVIFPTFDAENWGGYSPGLQYFRFAMAWACEQGLPYFDFTLGSEQYKSEFGATEVPLFELYQPLSLKGRAATAVIGAKWHVRQHPELAQFLRKTGHRLSLRSK